MGSSRLKITVITARFALAGVPLAQIRLAKALARRGHNVSMIIGYVDPECSAPLIDDVDLQIWNIPNVRGMFLRCVGHLLIDKPDIVFSAEDHLNAVVLLAALLTRSKTRISGSSRVTPFDTYSEVLFRKGWFLKQLSLLVMQRAQALTCVSQDMVKQYQQVFQNPPHQCVYNIVVDKQSRERIKESVDHPWLLEKNEPVLVAAGRLELWKGFGDLIDAVAIVRKSRSVKLLVLGDGPLRADLQRSIDTYNMTDSVDLVGYVENPLKYFRHSDVFVLASHVEGLPNVLVEAMMCGCTPVATDCPTGPREVLQGEKYGYLVPVRDPVLMAAAIQRAIDNPISSALLEEAVEAFEESRVIRRHFELLGLCAESYI